MYLTFYLKHFACVTSLIPKQYLLYATYTYIWKNASLRSQDDRRAASTLLQPPATSIFVLSGSWAQYNVFRRSRSTTKSKQHPGNDFYIFLVNTILFFCFWWFMQSDSDNSVSSVEVSTRQIRGPGEESQKNVDVRCCWKNCGVNFKTLDELAVHVTRFHASSGPDGLFYCGWEGCTRNNRGFNAR